MELEAIRTEQLGHLGIVSATIKQLGLIKEIGVNHKLCVSFIFYFPINHI